MHEETATIYVNQPQVALLLELVSKAGVSIAQARHAADLFDSVKAAADTLDVKYHEG
jgi:hypothetical protein